MGTGRVLVGTAPASVKVVCALRAVGLLVLLVPLGMPLVEAQAEAAEVLSVDERDDVREVLGARPQREVPGDPWHDLASQGSWSDLRVPPSHRLPTSTAPGAVWLPMTTADDRADAV